ncbi:MAG: hypothetical protein HY286_18110 [Planctomycetes bacterium]|nr:hypothetical protein [Planctomycetota bacterium]
MQSIRGVLGVDGKTTLSATPEFMQDLSPYAFATCVASRGSGNTLQQFDSEPLVVKE